VNFGASLSRSYIGNSFQVQLADCAGTQPRLTYLSYTQTLLEDRMSFRVGRLTLNSVYGEEFMGSEYFKSFASIGFDLIPEGLFFNVAGAAGYPRTTWGTRLSYSPTKRFYAQAGAYNADTHQLEGSQHGLDFSLRGPLFAIGEVGFRRFAEGDDDSKPTRDIKAGGFYTVGTHYNVSSGVLKPVRGLYGFYTLGDQQIWRLKVPPGTSRAEAELSRWGDVERQRHVGVFASLVVVPEPRTNVMPYFFNVGAMSYGPSPQRPRDFFGLGFAYGSNSRSPVSIPPVSSTEQIPLPVPPNEQTLELTYGFVLRPGVLLQPSLQYIVHPKGIASIPNALPPGATVPNALALGVNTVISF
jgi:porin